MCKRPFQQEVTKLCEVRKTGAKMCNCAKSVHPFVVFLVPPASSTSPDWLKRPTQLKRSFFPTIKIHMWKGKVKISNQVWSFIFGCISKHILKTYIDTYIVFNFCQVKEGCGCGRLPLKDNHWNFSTPKESAQNAHKLSSSRCVEDEMQELKSKSRVVKLAVFPKKLDENIM